jgi:hypothetical protein
MTDRLLTRYSRKIGRGVVMGTGLVILLDVGFIEVRRVVQTKICSTEEEHEEENDREENSWEIST